MSYFYVFLQSNLLELPVYFWLWRKVPGKKWPEGLALFTGMNAVTHPLVFFVLLSLPISFLDGILLAEAVAIGAEAIFLLWFTGLGLRRCLGASVLANLVSWQVAPALTYLIQ